MYQRSWMIPLVVAVIAGMANARPDADEPSAVPAPPCASSQPAATQDPLPSKGPTDAEYRVRLARIAESIAAAQPRPTTDPAIEDIYAAALQNCDGPYAPVSALPRSASFAKLYDPSWMSGMSRAFDRTIAAGPASCVVRPTPAADEPIENASRSGLFRQSVTSPPSEPYFAWTMTDVRTASARSPSSPHRLEPRSGFDSLGGAARESTLHAMSPILLRDDPGTRRSIFVRSDDDGAPFGGPSIRTTAQHGNLRFTVYAERDTWPNCDDRDVTIGIILSIQADRGFDPHAAVIK